MARRRDDPGRLSGAAARPSTVREFSAGGLVYRRRVNAYPRIRFMGSKHRLAPRLAEIFATLPDGPAVDGHLLEPRHAGPAQRVCHSKPDLESAGVS